MSSVTRKRLLLASLITLAAVTVFWWRYNHLTDEQDESAIAIALLEVIAGTAYRYDENGNNHLILKSAEVRYYPDKRGTHFQYPELIRKDGAGENFLRATQAVENRARTEIRLYGNVRGVHDDPRNAKKHTVFESDTLRYHIATNEAASDDPVVITTPDSTTHANGAIWQLNQNLFILEKNVRSHYAPGHVPWSGDRAQPVGMGTRDKGNTKAGK